MGIISEVKDLTGLIKKIGDIDLYKKILDLQSSILELSEKNVEQKEEIKRLKEIQEITNKMTFKDQLYYQENDSEPFCPRCWESEKKLYTFIEMVKVITNVKIAIRLILLTNIEKKRLEGSHLGANNI